MYVLLLVYLLLLHCLPNTCLFEDIRSYHKVQNISDLSSISNTSEILYLKRIGEDVLHLPSVKASEVIRNRALLVKINDGLVFQHQEMHASGIIDPGAKSIFAFHQWDLWDSSLAKSDENYVNIDRIETYDEAMSFAIPSLSYERDCKLKRFITWLRVFPAKPVCTKPPWNSIKPMDQPSFGEACRPI